MAAVSNNSKNPVSAILWILLFGVLNDVNNESRVAQSSLNLVVAAFAPSSLLSKCSSRRRRGNSCNYNIYDSSRSISYSATKTRGQQQSLWSSISSSSSSTADESSAGFPSPIQSSTTSSLSQQKESIGTTTTGTATIAQEVFNLVKSIVGAGVLTLPSGIAAYGNAPSAVIPAIALIAGIGGLSAYCFGLIGRVCSLTNTTSMRSAWSASVSDETSWIPALSVTLKTVFAILAYSMILADTFQSLLIQTAGVHVHKTVVLSAVTTFLLLPLCLLKNLSSLAPFSLLGCLGMLYTCVAMAIRCTGGDYLKGGRFFASNPALRPAFGTRGASSVVSLKSAILIGMLSTSYMAHFNAPKFYTELKDNTIPRYMIVVTTSFAISILLYACMASLGFLTFGQACSGLILKNYSTRDALMGLARIAVALSIVFSYPLAFVGARDGILDLFQRPQQNSNNNNNNNIRSSSDRYTSSFRNNALITVSMLTSVTIAALSIPDVSFVLAFAGSTLGNALIYIYPAIMFRGAMLRHHSSSITTAHNKSEKMTTTIMTVRQKAEVKFALSSAALGLVMGTLGAIKAVQSLCS